MKKSLSELEQFISDFNLRQASGVIAFNANIHFNNGGHTQAEESEVHIITSDNIGAIYFLSVDGKDVPDMFSVKDNRFIYDAGKCLTIEGPVHTVAVFPTTKQAEQ